MDSTDEDRWKIDEDRSMKNGKSKGCHEFARIFTNGKLDKNRRHWGTKRSFEGQVRSQVQLGNEGGTSERI